jgi:ribonuclease G
MAKEICISSTPHETRLAILEDDQLAEIYYERENEYTLAGSIYNGRVTRVLPGMQSAFVDLGLERDAFLYVTDFLELEDPEETDELEKAAASGGIQPPREVRHVEIPERAPEHSPERVQERVARSPQKAEPEARRERRPVIEVVSEAVEEAQITSEPQIISEQPEGEQEDYGAPGAKRWRGRHRRRGSRSTVSAPEARTQVVAPSETYFGETAEPEVAPEIHAAAGTPDDKSLSHGWETAAPTSEPAARIEQAHTPFVLPGESLSKYGAAPAEEASKSPGASSSQPAYPVSSYKPSTMIQSPIEWDGSGLLPGESLSKHRSRKPEIEAVSEAQGTGSSAHALEEEGLVVEITDPGLISVEESEIEAVSKFFVSEEEEEIQLEETTVVSPKTEAQLPAKAEDVEIENDRTEPAVEAAASPGATRDGIFAEEACDAPVDLKKTEKVSDTDATATHNVDPLPPTGFRFPLFGLGGKKKAEEETAKPQTASTSVSSVSAYAPSNGLLEEEMIEEVEFAAPRHLHGKVEESDLDDFEEETLPTRPHAGQGDRSPRAQIEQRIPLDFDGKADDDEGFEEDDEEEPIAEEQPASGEGQRAQRRERGGRERRGRGGAGAQGGQSGKGRGPSRRSAQTTDLPIISDLLKPGQEILVQIAKEPIAKKGARITSHIALPGRFLVFMPTVTHIGVSRKIASDEERQRLKRILVHERGEAAGGFIVRTAAEGASEEELRADLRFLLHLWDEIKQRSESSKSPALIYHDLGLIERILRDQVSSNFSNIWVDSEADYERIVRFLNRFSPTLVRRVKLYTKELPLFEHFGIQDEISKALRSKVWLKSGGSIVINQTEALVAIDINTGKYIGKSSRLEDTIVKTNLDAVPEIVRQIRLRDLGGIIVIDFIDMDDRKNRFKVMAALEEALKSDRAPTKVLQFNDFGLVAITRKRVKQSLERTLSVPCPTCQATGMVKSPATVCNEIYTELRKMRKHFEGADVLLRVHPETVKVLKSNNASWLTEFEELIGKNILIKSDPTLHPEQFDIQG